MRTGCFDRRLLAGLAALWLALLLPLELYAAEIVGAKEAETPEGAAEELPVEAGAFRIGNAGDAAVVQFSILPALDDPTKMETRIFVQKKGGRQICLQIRSDDVVTRAYRPSGEDPFAPVVPTVLRGKTSGQSGDLLGFNEKKVFIQPHSAEDIFTENECFVADGQEACFVADTLECDQILEEQQEVCVGVGLTQGGCGGLGHANAAANFGFPWPS